MPKVDLSNYKDREQAYVKHCLLEGYLPEWAYKVGSTWDSLVYVDAFAGPWQTKHPNYADSSFGIAVDALRRCQTGLHDSRGRDLNIECILVEQDNDAFAHLKEFAVSQSRTGFIVRALPGKFAKQVPAINELITASGRNPFRFVFLDPKGWADIPMDKLQPLLRNRSCEVLINLMTRHIIRFLDQLDREDSYYKLFGRAGVIEVLRNMPPEERVERAVQEYSLSLKLLCGFKYVSSAVILSPNEDSIRYFLIYATNHPRGVEVFKAAEIKAARIQDDVRYEAYVSKKSTLPLMFDQAPRSRLAIELWQRYIARARKKVTKMLSDSASRAGLPYADVFCEAMAFPLVTPEYLQDWLAELQNKGSIRFRLSGVSRKKPSAAKEDFIVVINPQSLG